MPVAKFERLVVDAIDMIPEGLAQLIDNVAFLIEDEGEDPGVLGLYDGVPLTERETYGGMVMPDRIFVYRLPLCDFCETEEQLAEEVLVTIVHEIAHHFGIDDDRLHELGWD